MGNLPGEDRLIALAFAVAVFLLIVIYLFQLRRRPAPVRRTSEALQMPCENCQRELVFHTRDLQELSPAEVALVVSALGDMSGRVLAEYVCPYCEASHCFDIRGTHPTYLGLNIYTSQSTTSKCKDCGNRLKRPHWSEGAYDGRIAELRELSDEYGLLCDWCNAVSCVACCVQGTKNRTPDGSLLCPRCFRGPMTRVYHF